MDIGPVCTCTKECRAFSIDVCPLPNWTIIVTITSSRPYEVGFLSVQSQQNSVAACKIDLKVCISKPKWP